MRSANEKWFVGICLDDKAIRFGKTPRLIVTKPKEQIEFYPDREQAIIAVQLAREVLHN